MPDTLRSCIVAEPGYTFISLDASQIELRVLAIMSQDPQMLEDLRTGDLHMATAVRMYGFTEDKDEMSRRRYLAKQGNFAEVYEIGDEGLSVLLGCTLEEVTAFREDRQRTYPRLYEWKDEVKAKAKEDGYVVNMFGRIRPIPELKAGNWRVRENAEKEIVNTLAQGTAVDIVKLAGLYLRKMLDLGVRFVLQVHDEWLLECPNALLEQSLAVCRTLSDVFSDYPFSIKIGTIYNQLEGI